MRFYFVSRFGNLTKIKPNSEISNKASVIYKLKLLDYFRQQKENIKNGFPYLYKGEIKEDKLRKNNRITSLFSNKEEVKVMKVIGIEYNQLIDSTQKYSL